MVGDDVVEHSISGSSRVITPSDVDVKDESAFGSAATQAIHIGDQVLWVTRDRRHIRAMDYSLEANAWVSRAVTFLAEHITEGGVRDVQFGRSPYPVISFINHGSNVTNLAVCTYDRGEEVIAWWKINGSGLTGYGSYYAAAVLETTNGAEIWAAVTRLGTMYLERYPLHETGRQYLDCWAQGVVQLNTPPPAGVNVLTHFPANTSVRVFVNGVDSGLHTVSASGYLRDVGPLGATLTYGLDYTATAETMPLDGGNPKGTSLGGKRRFARVAAVLNNSTGLPTVNGVRLSNEGDAAPYTGVYDAAVQGWDDEGVVTLVADQPYRTEVLALLGTASTGKV
jgi:hypothetical protein